MIWVNQMFVEVGRLQCFLFLLCFSSFPLLNVCLARWHTSIVVRKQGGHHCDDQKATMLFFWGRVHKSDVFQVKGTSAHQTWANFLQGGG